MSRAPKVLARRAVELTKCLLVGVMAFLAVSTTTTTEGMTAAQEISTAPAGAARLDKLMARHDCSPTGFGADVIPGSSLVLQDDKVRHVSFDDGWAVYTGEQSGTLLAVCRPAL